MKPGLANSKSNKNSFEEKNVNSNQLFHRQVLLQQNFSSSGTEKFHFEHELSSNRWKIISVVVQTQTDD